MMDKIDDYIPSILTPRRVRKDNFNLTQLSTTSRLSLSRRRSGINQRQTNVQKNDYNISTTKTSFFNQESKIKPSQKVTLQLDSNIKPSQNLDSDIEFTFESPEISKQIESACSINDINLGIVKETDPNIDLNARLRQISESDVNVAHGSETNLNIKTPVSNNEIISQDFGTFDRLNESDKNTVIEINSASTNGANKENCCLRLNVDFELLDCDSTNIRSKNCNIKKIYFAKEANNIKVSCELSERESVLTKLSTDSEVSEVDESMNVTGSKRFSPPSVELEIKKKKMTNNEKVKVLVLNTNSLEKLSHVILQPPNIHLERNHNRNKSKIKSNYGVKKKGKTVFGDKICNNLTQTTIDNFTKRRLKTIVQENDNLTNELVFFDKRTDNGKSSIPFDGSCSAEGHGAIKEMNKKSAGDVEPKSTSKIVSQSLCTGKTDGESKYSINKVLSSGSNQHKQTSKSETSALPLLKNPSYRKSFSVKPIPPHKVITGTPIAVDAFCYGVIPNVSVYFLTHFHSDHYNGLKRNFNKPLFCSKITAELCMARLGVNSKIITILNMDETITVEGVQVTTVDANHCPGAVMLVLTLPTGKTVLHTGDFRATYIMESYPIFWNRDIHTIYLDTTYCNPRYDFQTQDDSLESALHILRQKKVALDKVGRKFSSVLIVCGTYTIGKERFFLGLARQIGCSVWACAEKDRVLQTVEGRSFSQAPAHACQIHVVPMRDLTHEKLHSYLTSLHGAFSEIIAFKPSGWEIGRSAACEKNGVTIHGIPYSEHSSFSELIRFVKYLQPKLIIPTVDIAGGINSVQKYFPCPVAYKTPDIPQCKLTDYFSIRNRQHVPAVT